MHIQYKYGLQALTCVKKVTWASTNYICSSNYHTAVLSYQNYVLERTNRYMIYSIDHVFLSCFQNKINTFFF